MIESRWPGPDASGPGQRPVHARKKPLTHIDQEGARGTDQQVAR